MDSIRRLASRAFVVVALVGFAISGPAAQAARVTPMIVDLKPTGRDSVGRVELTNDADHNIAYEVQMMRGDISPDGKLKLTPADDQFIVFPPQVIVEANSQQVFRIQYVGEDALDTSQVYYLSVKQIPVAFDPGVNQVQVVVNYNVLVNVVPSGTSPKADVKSAEYIERQQSTAGLTPDQIPDPIPTEMGIQVDLANDGTRYFYAGNATWKISAKTTAGEDFSMNYSGSEMTRVIGVGVVAPGKDRVFFIPTDKELAPGSVRVTVEP